MLILAVAHRAIIAVVVRESVALPLLFHHLHRENHLLALFVGFGEEAFIGTEVKVVSALPHLAEIRLGQIVLLEPHVSLAAQSIGSTPGHTSVIGVPGHIPVGDLGAIDAIRTVLHDKSPDLLLRRAAQAILVRSQVPVVIGNPAPQRIQAIIVIGPQELALGNALRLRRIGHVRHPADVLDHIIGPVDPLVETFPIGLEHRIVRLQRPKKVVVIEVDDSLLRVHDRRERIPVQDGTVRRIVIVEQVGIDPRHHTFGQRRRGKHGRGAVLTVGITVQKFVARNQRQKSRTKNRYFESFHTRMH